MREITKFYMVYLIGQNTPAYQHETLEEAEREAKRLTEKTGYKSFILGTIKSYELAKFKEEDCKVKDIPF